MPYRVAATNPRPGYDFAHERKALDLIGAEIVPVHADDDATYGRLIADMDAVMMGLKVSLTAEVIAGLKRCKIIASGGIGFDRVDVAAATAAGIPVTNIPDVFTEEVADQALLLLLAVNRKLLYCHETATNERWEQAFGGLGSMPKVHASTLGLVAFGNIARAVARRARG